MKYLLQKIIHKYNTMQNRNKWIKNMFYLSDSNVRK